MKKLLSVIDSISELTGKATSWLCIVMAMIMVYEVFMRYVFRVATIWAYDTLSMLGCTVYVLGWSYVHKHHGHIRIDLFDSKLSQPVRLMKEIILALVFFFPFSIAVTYKSISLAWDAWLMNERIIETYWYPPAAPIKSIVAMGMILLLLQGGAQFIRDLYFFAKGHRYD